MNAKILSILFILFAGIGFSSCKKENSESSYDAGKNQGEKLSQTVEAYKSGDILKQAEATVSLYTTYQTYKQNSSDLEWKRGFLEGATNFDQSKYSGLEKLLEQDFNTESIVNLLPDLIKLLN